MYTFPTAAVVSSAWRLLFHCNYSCCWSSAYHLLVLSEDLPCAGSFILTNVLSVRNWYTHLPSKEIGLERLRNLPQVVWVVELRCQFRSLRHCTADLSLPSYVAWEKLFPGSDGAIRGHDEGRIAAPRALAARKEALVCAQQSVLLLLNGPLGRRKPKVLLYIQGEPCSRNLTSSETSQVMNRFDGSNKMPVRIPRLSQGPQIEKNLWRNSSKSWLIPKL